MMHALIQYLNPLNSQLVNVCNLVEQNTCSHITNFKQQENLSKECVPRCQQYLCWFVKSFKMASMPHIEWKRWFVFSNCGLFSLVEQSMSVWWACGRKCHLFFTWCVFVPVFVSIFVSVFVSVFVFETERGRERSSGGTTPSPRSNSKLSQFSGDLLPRRPALPRVHKTESNYKNLCRHNWPTIGRNPNNLGNYNCSILLSYIVIPNKSCLGLETFEVCLASHLSNSSYGTASHACVVSLTIRSQLLSTSDCGWDCSLAPAAGLNPTDWPLAPTPSPSYHSVNLPLLQMFICICVSVFLFVFVSVFC